MTLKDVKQSTSTLTYSIQESNELRDLLLIRTEAKGRVQESTALTDATLGSMPLPFFGC